MQTVKRKKIRTGDGRKRLKSTKKLEEVYQKKGKFEKWTRIRAYISFFKDKNEGEGENFI